MDPIQIVLQAVDQTAPALGTIAQNLGNLLQQVSGLTSAFRNVGEGVSFPRLPVEDVVTLAKALQVSFAEAEKLTGAVGLTGTAAARAIAQIREFNSVKLSATQQFEVLNRELGVSQEQFNKLSQAAKQGGEKGGEGLGGLAGAAGGLFGKIGLVAFGFNQVQMAVQTMMAVAAPAFDLLIGANEKLNAQLLSSQANLASATRIFKNGSEVTDPLQKITASQPALKAALKQIEKDTVDLVGVTSEEVNGLFQITLQNAALLNQQSKQFPGPIEAATSLTKGWAASFKVIGIGFYEANQEINSLVKGQITQDSKLAKNLAINNEMVSKWKAQGVLVDRINERLEVFVRANAIASRSIEGQSSNIKDIIQIIGREVGQPLLAPVVSSLEAVYGTLKANQAGIQAFFTQVTDGLLKSVGGIGASLQPLFGALGGLVSALAPGLGAIFGIVVKLVELLAGVLSPVLSVIVAILTPVVRVVSGILQAVDGIAGGFLAAFRTLTPLVNLLTNTFSGVLQGLSGSIDAGINGIGQLFNALQPVGDFFYALFVLAGKLFAPAIESVITFTLTAFPLLKNLGDLMGNLDKFGAQFAQSLQPAIEGVKTFTLILFPVINNIKSIINSIKSLTPVLEKLSGVKIGGKGLKDMGDEATAGADKIEYQARKIEDLGTTWEQTKKKIDNAKKSLAEQGGGDTQVYNQSAKDLISFTQQAVEQGQISKADAINNLTEVANRRNLDVATQQQAQEALTKVRKTELDKQKSDVDAQIAAIQEQVASGYLSDAAGAEQTTALKKKQLDQQLEDTRAAILAEQNAILEGRGSQTKLKQLQAQEKQQQSEVAKTSKETRDRSNQEALKDFDEYQKTLDAKKAKGLVTEREFADQSLQISLNRLDAEQKQIDEKRSRLNPNDKEGNEALNAQAAEITKKRADLTRKAGEDRLNLLRAEGEAEVKALEAKKAQGLLTETQFNEESFKLTQARLSKELELINQQKAKTPKGDTETLRKLANQETEIIKQKVDAQERFENEKIAILERAQKKALDIVKAAETEREIETQKLLNKRQIREAEANERGLQQKRSTLQEELKLEAQKTAALAALPKFSDPTKEEERQAKIRASRQRTGELTLEIVRNEGQLQEARAKVIQDAIDQRLKATQNLYTAEQQNLSKISQQQDYLVKSYDRQNQLLSARKDLQQAISGYVDGEYKLAESLTTSESKKKVIKEEAARSRLAFLDREQALERRSLDLEIAKNEALLQREIIQNRIEQSRAKADLATSVAEQQKTAVDPKATQAEKDARALAVQAAQEKLVGTQYQGVLLDQQGKQRAGLDDARRDALDYKQALQFDQARADVVNNLRDRGAARRGARDLASETLAKARFENNPNVALNLPAAAIPSYEDFRRSQVQQQLTAATGGGKSPAFTPTLAPVPGTTGSPAIPEIGLTSLRQAISESLTQGFATLQSGPVTLNNTITNQFTGADVNNGKAGAQMGQQILNTLYEVGRLAKAKQ